jgi:archaemetzincin
MRCHIVFPIIACLMPFPPLLIAGEKEKKLYKLIQSLKPIHQKMGKTKPGDWLATRKEPGQSFRQYIYSSPAIPNKRRKVIYIQPIGSFTEDERKIVKKTAKYLNIFYGLPVITQKDLKLSIIPNKGRRKNWGQEQLLTTYILYNVLKPKLPDDAMLMLGMTATDLWPGKGWNFVFGQASLRERVGVWSINRNGNPSGGKEHFKLCLIRTLKTASHEAGHMFSIRHCIAYECGMCGSNSRDESDCRVMAFCPECVGKVLWATGNNPIKRFQKLIKFCKENDLKDEQQFYTKSLKTLQTSSKVKKNYQ